MIPAGARTGVAHLSLGGRDFGAPVLCAPLSGITDVPFRRLLRRLGAGLVFSEMVASGELMRGTRESLLRVMADGAGLRAVQLAGRDPAMMRAAAERLAGEGADLIDINFGCPAKKVVGGQCGSALMREPELAARLMAATLEGAGSVPVSVKMRLGWSRDSLNAVEIARSAASIGLSMVTVHGRTRDQFYEGYADWAAVGPVRQAIDLPLVVNGDIETFADIGRARAASGADAVMVGRALCGRPWLIGLMTGALTPHDLKALALDELVAGHYEAMIDHYGEAIGVRHARKHLGWYLGRLVIRQGGALATERAALMSASEASAALRLIGDIFGGIRLADLESTHSMHLEKAA
ncbi:tRNA-dihydrouridine synthase [Aureimonas sp. OT7]|uniref:tRNA dihydrouridine synthase n=1 Tax=Aureimonas sp. OT7 TaxID=2816454 RepID=UPI00178171FC|nr:tRNA-dihydrouridine synthase [Aureimonas sp. OT7]QOG05511.1 tRNA-dihydrouridine synthase [Aureimonas sp. OT7]